MSFGDIFTKSLLTHIFQISGESVMDGRTDRHSRFKMYTEVITFCAVRSGFEVSIISEQSDIVTPTLLISIIIAIKMICQNEHVSPPPPRQSDKKGN